MKNKEERFELIKKIISSEVISNQDDLQLRLLTQGMDVTQATLSRDLKSLQVIKVSDAKVGYVYRLPSFERLHPTLEASQSRLNYLADGIRAISA